MFSISIIITRILTTVALLLLFTGDTLFQMAEVHRQIQVQLEDVVRLNSEKNHVSLVVQVATPLDCFCRSYTRQYFFFQVHFKYSVFLSISFCLM